MPRLWDPPAGTIPTMQVPSLQGVRRVHLVGVGGAGMRNLAKLLLSRGLTLSGSDLKDSPGLGVLRELGATVHVGHDPGHVADADVVIVSTAIGRSNPERREAECRSLPVWARQQAIAALAAGHETVAITGTHGKTTTTSMVATIAEEAGLDPSYLIGGDLNESGSGARAGMGEAFVYEADESDGSFLLGSPSVGVLTNVDVDHLDFYLGGRDEIERAFGEFATRCGRIVACGDDAGVRASLDLAGVQASTTYGTGDANDVVVRVHQLGPQGARGVLAMEDGVEIELSLPIDGAHNLLNAAAAVAAAGKIGVPAADAARTLREFRGVHRRFELRGSARGADFFDDYGHVPTEMALTLRTARRRNPRRLIALVQPHRYARVQALWRELGASVVEADLVLVTDIYGADQAPIPGVTGALVVDGVRLASPSTRTVYLPHRHDVIEYLDRELREGDLVVTMGCGDVWMLADAALERIRGDDR
jgi:UDP-N-acetylmuramate--alanine ligase